MASIGLSKFITAEYHENEYGCYYSAAVRGPKMVSADVSIEGREPTILFGDNDPAESYGAFGGGTLGVEIDELDFYSAYHLLGARYVSGANPARVVFSTDDNPVSHGVAFINKKLVHGVVRWRLIAFKRCKFMVPNYTLNTQAQTIEFQVPKLDATILRDFTGAWQAWGDYDTEANALSAVSAIFPTSIPLPPTP